MFLSLCAFAMEQFPVKAHPWEGLTQPQILQGFSNIELPIRMTGTQGSAEYGRCASLASTLSETYSLVTLVSSRPALNQKAINLPYRAGTLSCDRSWT